MVIDLNGLNILGFIILLCVVLSLGKFIRLILIKLLFPKASLKDIESFEKNTKRDYSFWIGKRKSESSSE